MGTGEKRLVLIKWSRKRALWCSRKCLVLISVAGKDWETYLNTVKTHQMLNINFSALVGFAITITDHLGSGGRLVQAMICWLRETAYCDRYSLYAEPHTRSSQEDKKDTRPASHHLLRKNIHKSLPQNPPRHLQKHELRTKSLRDIWDLRWRLGWW